MKNRFVRNLLIAVAAASLGGCGGGDGSVNSTPTPTPTPAPPPTQVPLASQPVAATESMEFAVIGGDLRIRWDNVSKAYEVMFPGKDWATISPMGIGGNPNYASAGSNNLLSFSGRDLYSYTGIVQTVAGDTAVREVYGIGTPASGVPVTGSASYTAQIFGTAGKYYFDNNGGHFDFDFAAGTLAGYFDPIASTANDQDSYELGRYDFVQTVFSGSQKFSGNLSHDGASAGSFSGLFTGPQAQELMGQWGLTFHDPVAPATTLNASGLFIGKKNP